MKRCAVALVLLAIALFAARDTAAGVGEVMRAARMLNEWRFEDARATIAKLAASSPRAPETRYLRAELAFLDGAYDQALELLDGLDDGAVYGNVGTLRSLTVSTLDATRGFSTYETEHVQIRFPPGKDEVIVELAAEVLERARAVIGEDLGFTPPEKIRVEILPRPRDLAKVSTLRESEIETTGTIALCKYGKLMVVTPRATLFGYGWMDTLVHEYVHYVVSRASHDKIPVWLHEGLARFQQTRWRQAPTRELNAMEQDLLATALSKRRLIGFDEMHPSMAKLPSQAAAALAFTEVYTMIGYLHAERGYAGLRQVIELAKGGATARRAVAEVMGVTWPKVESQWKRYLRSLDLSRSPELAERTDRIRFKKGDNDDPADENAGIDAVGSDKARRFARLGGILRARRMPRAAAVEYEKALQHDSDDLFVRAKLARTYLEIESFAKAIELATPLVQLDESDAGPATTLGVAHAALGRHDEAARAFQIALRVQPFDPAVRCGLAAAFEAVGDDRAERERRACATLGVVR